MNAISGIEKASTTKNIVSAFRAAGIVRRMSADMKYSILAIDRNEAHAVRHWNSFRQPQLEIMTHSSEIANHNPDYPRIKVATLDT